MESFMSFHLYMTHVFDVAKTMTHVFDVAKTLY